MARNTNSRGNTGRRGREDVDKGAWGRSLGVVVVGFFVVVVVMGFLGVVVVRHMVRLVVRGVVHFLVRGVVHFLGVVNVLFRWVDGRFFGSGLFC